MIVRIQKRENPFVQIDKRPLNDVRLSWKARGVLAYLLAKPDNWQVIMADLIKKAPDGRESIRSAFKELEKLGYAELINPRGEDGKLLGRQWVIHELPKDGFPDGRVLPTSGNPTKGKSPPTNNDTSNNVVTSNNELNNLSDSKRIVPTSDPLKETSTGNREESSAAAPPNSAPAEDDIFANVEGLKDDIGPKQYKALNKVAQKPAYRDIIRQLYAAGPDEERRFDILRDWLAYKKESRKNYSERGIIILIKQFAEFTGAELREAVDTSIGNTYQGVFPKKKAQTEAPGSRFQPPRPTVPAGYGRNEKFDINALPD